MYMYAEIVAPAPSQPLFTLGFHSAAEILKAMHGIQEWVLNNSEMYLGCPWRKCNLVPGLQSGLLARGAAV